MISIFYQELRFWGSGKSGLGTLKEALKQLFNPGNAKSNKYAGN